MGKTISDVCVRKGSQEKNLNLSRDFQMRCVTFPSRVTTKRALNNAAVSDGISSQNIDYLSSGSIPSSTKKLGVDSLSSSEGYLQYSSSELVGINYDTAEKYFSYLSTSLPFPGDQDIADGVESRMPGTYSNVNLSSIIRMETDSDKNSISAASFPSMERIRWNAIELKPVDPPGGKFFEEKQFYIQNAERQWEVVNIERWNPWNGTWQVKGEDSDSFPAAPIALKSKEEYEFLSRERKVKPRSFGSVS